ncbi:MAG: hypothetical protein DRH33_01145 [Candidatus Nealsonbacteria bacterium]|nr:MAG: hypothetical protein DRH33_01145 [Candidatus Nealsonbacteria bacterium]
MTEEDKELIIRFDLYPQTGAPIDFIDCIYCGFRNIINCPYPGKRKRLSSAECMKCGKELTCPSCGNALKEGLITERDGILFCEKCGLWINIW